MVSRKYPEDFKATSTHTSDSITKKEWTSRVLHLGFLVCPGRVVVTWLPGWRPWGSTEEKESWKVKASGHSAGAAGHPLHRDASQPLPAFP